MSIDLPKLTEVDREVFKRFNATRFKWRFRDGPALFEAFYANESLEKDEKGKYAPLIVSYIPENREKQTVWVHAYRVRKNGSTGMLFADSYLGEDYGGLHDILHIGRSGNGPPWSPGEFLERAQRESAGVPGNWPRHVIRNGDDIPESYRRNVEESDKIYWAGMKQWTLKRQSKRNAEKTQRICGQEVQKYCKDYNYSTCWTDDPSRGKGNIPLTVYQMKQQSS